MKHFNITPTIRALLMAGAAVETKEDGDLTQLVKAMEDHHKATGERLGVVDEKMAGFIARMTEIEQKSVRHGDTPLRPETWGEQAVKAEAYKAVSSNWRGRVRIDVKTTATLTNASGGAAGDAGALAPADRQGGYLALPRAKLRMRDVFAPGQTDKGSIEWPRQVARSNNAASVAEGALKPQSDMRFDMLTWPVRTLAHWMLASRQILDDASGLQSAIDSDLRYDLAYVEDVQLLLGVGTGTDLLGVYTNAPTFAPLVELSSAGTITKIDVLLLAIAQVQAADSDPDFIAVNPLDWVDIQSIKNDVGDYLGPGPFSAQAAILWRLPVVETKAMPQGNFLVGAGKRGAQIFDRTDATVEISTEDSDNFRKNLVTLLCEERLAFVIKRQDAFVKGNFNTALAL